MYSLRVKQRSLPYMLKKVMIPKASYSRLNTSRIQEQNATFP